jgi:hypothetical protein
MQRAADFMEGRFNGLAPPKTRAAAETSEGIAVATANIGDRPQVGTPTLVADARSGQRPGEIDPFRPGNGMLDVINDRYFNLDGRQVANPYGERMQEMLKQLETPQFSPERNRDNVAALMEAAVAGKFKLDEPIQVGLGNRDNLFAMQGNGDAANRVAVSLSDTNGAYQRFSEAVVAKVQEQVQAPQTTLAQAPVQETEQRRATISV